MVGIQSTNCYLKRRVGQLKGRMKEIVIDARFEDTTENISVCVHYQRQ